MTPIDGGTVIAGDLSTIGWTSSTDKVSSIGSAIIDETNGLVDITGRDVNPVPILSRNAVLDAEETEISTSRLQSNITLDGKSNISLACFDVRSSKVLDVGQYTWYECGVR